MRLITSDWHIHSVASYDASLHMQTLVDAARQQGLTAYGVSDHVNVPSWIHYLKASAELVQQFARPELHFGVELTTISGYLEQYNRQHGTSDGYTHPGTTGVDPIALPLTREELTQCGVEYVIGAEHFLLNAPRTRLGVAKEMQRQNLFCACSPLVDIVGHPYLMFGTYDDGNGHQVPYDDFSIIDWSMRREFYAALRENGKMMEVNGSFFGPDLPEKWKKDYAEFAKGAAEYGIPLTFGSDCHGPEYPDLENQCAPYFTAAGLTGKDFVLPVSLVQRKAAGKG